MFKRWPAVLEDPVVAAEIQDEVEGKYNNCAHQEVHRIDDGVRNDLRTSNAKKHTYGRFRPERDGALAKAEPLWKSASDKWKNTMERVGSVWNSVEKSHASPAGRIVPGVFRGAVRAPLLAAP
ncbi:MAG: hypothetical protein M1816_005512 [Peltula sp. TS41687]|nr:MAG: hypothetical protein M1816_005512 [Peltula sp. TS41687]